MTNVTPAPTRGEVWMLDTFGNVHSLVNACQKLGFKVNRITSPSQLSSAHVLPRESLTVESSVLRSREFWALYVGTTE
jgi:hypothetical protein